MKVKIWKKDDYFTVLDSNNNGRSVDMDPSVVELPIGPIPLVWNYHHNDVDSIMGHVNDVRIEDGEIVGEVSFRTDLPMEDHVKHLEEGKTRVGGYYLYATFSDDGKIVSGGRLVSAAIIPLLTIPPVMIP